MLDFGNSTKPKKKSGAQKLLEVIEDKLRTLIKEKKELWKKFKEKNEELEALRISYKYNLEEAERIQNQLILLWDYYHREVEILELGKKIQAGVLPAEREAIMKEQLKLIEFNKPLEKGFKKREISADIINEIKKRLGIWEGNKKEEEGSK